MYLFTVALYALLFGVASKSNLIPSLAPSPYLWVLMPHRCEGSLGPCVARSVSTLWPDRSQEGAISINFGQLKGRIYPFTLFRKNSWRRTHGHREAGSNLTQHQLRAGLTQVGKYSFERLFLSKNIGGPRRFGKWLHDSRTRFANKSTAGLLRCAMLSSTGLWCLGRVFLACLSFIDLAESSRTLASWNQCLSKASQGRSFLVKE